METILTTLVHQKNEEIRIFSETAISFPKKVGLRNICEGLFEIRRLERKGIKPCVVSLMSKVIEITLNSEGSVRFLDETAKQASCEFFANASHRERAGGIRGFGMARRKHPLISSPWSLI
jgi:hypothetical protein